MSSLVRTTAASAVALATADAKAHLRVVHADEDALIAALVAAATQLVESVTRRALINQSWTLYLDSFAELRTLAVMPVSAVTSIKYYDATNTLQTLAATVYDVDIKAEPARVLLAYGQVWPETYSRPNAVEVLFTAGYGSSDAAVPQAIRQSMLLLVGQWYTNRESANVGNIVNTMPFAVDALLAPFKVEWF